MPPATPQRTAETLAHRADADDRAGDRVRRRHRDAEPGREEERHRAAGLARRTRHGLELGDPLPIVFTIRQPPNSVPSPIAAVARDHDPERQPASCVRGITGGDQQQPDDPHRLLRVVAAVAEAVRAPPRRAAGCGTSGRRGRGVDAPEDPRHRDHQQRRRAASRAAGDEDERDAVLRRPLATSVPTPALGHRRAREAADERMRRARRECRSTT